jgi:hypothetical protein
MNIKQQRLLEYCRLIFILTLFNVFYVFTLQFKFFLLKVQVIIAPIGVTLTLNTFEPHRKWHSKRNKRDNHRRNIIAITTRKTATNP